MSIKKSVKLPEVLITYRKLNGLTQAFVAEKLNISRSTYTYYETGKTEPSFNSLAILAKMYNISVDAFLQFDDITVLNDSKYVPKMFVPTKNFDTLEQEEKELIATFRLASPVQKRKVLNILYSTQTKVDGKKSEEK
ncbi:MAG: helix-turn-helix transcriptional regulator [Clostridia bacterium]